MGEKEKKRKLVIFHRVKCSLETLCHVAGGDRLPSWSAHNNMLCVLSGKSTKHQAVCKHSFNRTTQAHTAMTITETKTRPVTF